MGLKRLRQPGIRPQGQEERGQAGGGGAVEMPPSSPSTEISDQRGSDQFLAQSRY